jgi:hypothetical protein
LHAGEYFVVGMDIEQYDTDDPEKYLKGLLASEQEDWVGEAYKSYLAVLPSPTIGFDDFANKVSVSVYLHYLFWMCVRVIQAHTMRDYHGGAHTMKINSGKISISL